MKLSEDFEMEMEVENKINNLYRNYTNNIKGNPIGGAHHLRRSSLKKIFKLIDSDIINSSVCDIGCGVGYVVYVSLGLGAKKVYGIEIEEQHELCIPNKCYKDSNSNFVFKDFNLLNDCFFFNFDIVFQLIGLIDMIKRMVSIFKFSNIKIFIFLKPSRGFNWYYVKLQEDANEYRWEIYEIDVEISISGERRRVIIIKKTKESKQLNFIEVY